MKRSSCFSTIRTFVMKEFCCVAFFPLKWRLKWLTFLIWRISRYFWFDRSTARLLVTATIYLGLCTKKRLKMSFSSEKRNNNYRHIVDRPYKTVIWRLCLPNQHLYTINTYKNRNEKKDSEPLINITKTEYESVICCLFWIQ